MASLRCEGEVVVTQAYSQGFGYIVINFGFVGREQRVTSGAWLLGRRIAIVLTLRRCCP